MGKKDKSLIISNIAEMLLLNNNEAAKTIICSDYPHIAFNTEKHTHTTAQKMEQFISDGFIDRYTGQRLINPGMLKVISFYFPNEFPFHPHWKMTKTHIAYWELIPTIDHIIPIARGGQDDKSNWATTSMKNNSIKSNYTVEEIQWTLYPQGNIKDWDGLSKSFIKLVDSRQEVLEDNYIRTWYKVSKKLLQ